MVKKLCCLLVIFLLSNLPCRAAVKGDVPSRLGILQNQLHMLGKAFETKKYTEGEKDIKKGVAPEPTSSFAQESVMHERVRRVAEHIRKQNKKHVSDIDILRLLYAELSQNLTEATKKIVIQVATNLYGYVAQKPGFYGDQLKELFRRQSYSEQDAENLARLVLVLVEDPQVPDMLNNVRHALGSQGSSTRH